MQRFALPTNVKLEGVTLFLEAEADGMESLRPLFIRTGARLALGAIFDVGHLAGLFRPPGDMDHAIAMLRRHDLAAVIVQTVADDQGDFPVMEVVDVGPGDGRRQRDIARKLLPQITKFVALVPDVIAG